MKKLTLTIMLLMITTHPLFAGILRVPSEYSTIQGAIHAARNSDTVLVAEGTYFENINYRGKNIVVASNYIFTRNVQTIVNTVIDGSHFTNGDSASVAAFLNNEDSSAVLDGFTLTGGRGTRYQFGANIVQEGGGIILDSSRATIRNNIIINNSVVGVPPTNSGGGGGIATMYGQPRIYNNLIVSNKARYAAGMVLNWSGAYVKNNIIYHNIGGESYGAGGIMIWKVPANSAFVENNTIVGNISARDAGGISIALTGIGVPLVKNTLVWGNRQTIGGQVTMPGYVAYCDVEDYSSGSNFSLPPSFEEGSFLLQSNSACVDRGDTNTSCLDAPDPANPSSALFPSRGTRRNDVGAFGGSFAKVLPLLNVFDFYLSNTSPSIRCNVGAVGTIGVEFLNLSSTRVSVDSIVCGTSLFHVGANMHGRMLGPLENDTIIVSAIPVVAGSFRDTLRIYHTATGIQNPVRLPVSLTADPSVGVNLERALPNKYALNPNYPNPFNPSTRISYDVPSTNDISIKLFDMLGREIGTLVRGVHQPGKYSLRWDAQNCASGTYICRMQAGAFTQSTKLLLMR
ncbi:MAG: T9SS type A sorting domain-containing protein [Ignavibacteriae bacterium]|nr:T9SS type A sorting domain-containing protein [Ignavibacteriota bacterium]